MTTPPDFSPGHVLTAANMNALGLWKITDLTASFTGGTAGSVSDGTVTIGTNNTAVTVGSAFSADYDNYLVTISDGAGSTDLGLTLTLGASIASYYFSGKGRGWNGVDVNQAGANQANWGTVAYATTQGIHGEFYLIGPHNTKKTIMHGVYISPTSAAIGAYYDTGGFHDVATSYTSFTLTCSTGNISGGKIRVYGRRD